MLNSDAAHRSNNSDVKDKVLLRIGDFPFNSWKDGKSRFMECPVTDCLMTSDVKRYSRTADALVIAYLSNLRLRDLLPKPRHQVRRLINYEAYACIMGILSFVRILTCLQGPSATYMILNCGGVCVRPGQRKGELGVSFVVRVGNEITTRGAWIVFVV